jgi:hypothetical protein
VTETGGEKAVTIFDKATGTELTLARDVQGLYAAPSHSVCIL